MFGNANVSPLKQSALNYMVVLRQIKNYPFALFSAHFGSKTLEPLAVSVRAG